MKVGGKAGKVNKLSTCRNELYRETEDCQFLIQNSKTLEIPQFLRCVMMYLCKQYGGRNHIIILFYL